MNIFNKQSFKLFPFFTAIAIEDEKEEKKVEQRNLLMVFHIIKCLKSRLHTNFLLPSLLSSVGIAFNVGNFSSIYSNFQPFHWEYKHFITFV